ncbi:MAG TPA: Hpt domain-containing protein [Opitutaceae bacterium]|nr:Hpt domain-containing protein [Opitutaceae bacterium]
MSDQPVLDSNSLENLRALSPDDGGAFVREVIEIFLQETPSRLTELDRALAAADVPAITHLAHSIKGSCANFGATRLAAVSLAMELAAKRSDVPAARAAGPELVAAYDATRVALENFLRDLK